MPRAWGLNLRDPKSKHAWQTPERKRLEQKYETLEFSTIALHLKYSLREVTNAIMHLAIKRNKKIWYDIHQFYKTLKTEVNEFV